MKEREFLAEQHRRATVGLERAVVAIGRQVQETTDLTGIVRRHPIAALSAGAATGFAVGRFAPFPGAALAPMLSVMRRPLTVALETLVAAAIATAKSGDQP